MTPPDSLTALVRDAEAMRDEVAAINRDYQAIEQRLAQINTEFDAMERRLDRCHGLPARRQEKQHRRDRQPAHSSRVPSRGH